MRRGSGLTERLTIRLTADQLRALGALSRIGDVDKADVVRDAIDAWIHRHRRQIEVQEGDRWQQRGESGA